MTSPNLTLARAARIGLGLDTLHESRAVPERLRARSVTDADGTLRSDVREGALAAVDDDGLLYGRLADGAARVMTGAGERPPEFAAGVGSGTGDGKAPRIEMVLAVAENAERAAIRAAWLMENRLAEAIEAWRRNRPCGLWVLPIRAEDADLLRARFERRRRRQNDAMADTGLGGNAAVESIDRFEEVLLKLKRDESWSLDPAAIEADECAQVDLDKKTNTAAIW